MFDLKKIQFTLFIWYTQLLVQLKIVWEHVVFWAGLYLPLCVVNIVVRRTFYVEDSIAKKFQLEFFRIEYQIPYRSGKVHKKLRYDITARVLWLIHFVGTNYMDLKEYVPRALPWGDIHSHRFNNEEAEVVFNYYVNEPFEDDGQEYHNYMYASRLNVMFNDKFRWAKYEKLEDARVNDIIFNTLNFLEPEEPDSEQEENLIY